MTISGLRYADSSQQSEVRRISPNSLSSLRIVPLYRSLFNALRLEAGYT